MKQPSTILIVDDEQIILDSIRKHLRREDYNIQTVLTAKEAIERFKSESINIVLTDLMMPEIDGMELMAIIKKDHPDVRVIMITGYATISTAQQAKQLGAFDYLAKPFTKSELLKVIEKACDR